MGDIEREREKRDREKTGERSGEIDRYVREMESERDS